MICGMSSVGLGSDYHYDRASPGVLHLVGVLRIGQEGEMAGSGLLHSGDACDVDGAVADKAAVQPLGDFEQRGFKQCRAGWHVS